MKNKVFRRFLRRKVSVVAAIILLTIILACIFGPMFITTDPLEQDILNAYQAPSSAHWFGTDNMGRDIFIRIDRILEVGDSSDCYVAFGYLAAKVDKTNRAKA